MELAPELINRSKKKKQNVLSENSVKMLGVKRRLLQARRSIAP
jgi:hypothetical protein